MFKVTQILAITCTVLVIGNRFSPAEPIRPDATTTVEIAGKLDTSTLGGYLISMAKAANINAFADVTDLEDRSVRAYPTTPGAIAGMNGPDKQKWAPVLINVMGDLVADQKLSTYRYSENTFLFWPEPNLLDVTKAQLNATKVDNLSWLERAFKDVALPDAPEETVLPDPLSDAELNQHLRAFLKESSSWTGQAAERKSPVDLQFGFSKLPPLIQSMLVFEIRRQIVGDANFYAAQPSFWDAPERKIRLASRRDTTYLEIPYKLPVKEGDGLSQSAFTLNVPDDVAQEIAVSIPQQKTLDSGSRPAPGRRDNRLGAHLFPSRSSVVFPPSSLSLSEIPICATEEKGADENPFSEIYQDLTAAKVRLALQKDAKLKGIVSYESKRVELAQFLKSVGEQCGVQFVYGADAPNKKFLAATMRDLPLYEVMSVTSRMFGFTWVKSAATDGKTVYELGMGNQSAPRTQLLQMGDPARYRYRFAFYNRADRQMAEAEIARQIVREYGKELLAAKQEGVLLSSIKPELRTRLIAAMYEPFCESVNQLLYHSNQWIADSLNDDAVYLRFGNSVASRYKTPFLGLVSNEGEDVIRFNVQTSDGKFVLPVFDCLKFERSKGESLENPKPSRRR